MPAAKPIKKFSTGATPSLFGMPKTDFCHWSGNAQSSSDRLTALADWAMSNNAKSNRGLLEALAKGDGHRNAIAARRK
jgi:hypothetical protein